MKVGSLFSGIGGFDLGLERAGFEPAWFCESDRYCRDVLAARWPDLPCYSDVRTLRGADVELVDVLCGGFPCQDLSVAGRGAGLEGERSGLWAEFARLIGDLRPRYVIVENVSALLARGLGRVLGDLAALGYDAEWDCIPASAVGAPHRRDRVWLVAYPDRRQLRDQSWWGSGPDRQGAAEPRDDGEEGPLADPYGGGEPQQRGVVAESRRRIEHGGEAGDVADAAGPRRRHAGSGEGRGPDRPGSLGRPQRAGQVTAALADPEREGLEGHRAKPGGAEITEPRDGGSSRPYPDFERRDGRPWSRGELDRSAEPQDGSWWSVEPDVGRVANGVPARLDRVRVLGNALVPQIAEWIGLRIMEYEAER